MKLFRLLTAVLLGLAVSTVSAGIASASVPPPGGQSCSLSASRPFVSSGPTKTSVGKYAFTVEAVAQMDCSFIPYSFSVSSILHYSTEGSSAATRSSTVTCANHTYCTANAFYTRSGLQCGFTYYYDDYTQATGWYRATSTSSQVSVSSVTSSHAAGSSHNPSVCR